MKQHVHELLYLTFMAKPAEVRERGVSWKLLPMVVLLAFLATVAGFAAVILATEAGIDQHEALATVFNITLTGWAFVPMFLVACGCIVYVKALYGGNVE